MHLQDRSDAVAGDDGVHLSKLTEESLSPGAAYWVYASRRKLIKQDESTQQEAN